MWTLLPEQVSQAGISNYIPHKTAGCNYLSLPEIPASGNKVHIYAIILDKRYWQISLVGAFINGIDPR